MGGKLPKTQAEKHNAHGAGNGLSYGLGSMQGWRQTMEDTHTVKLQLPGGRPDWSFFAVYDGHAGSLVANYCADHMLDYIIPTTGRSGGDSVKDDIRKGFLKIDAHMRGLPEMRPQQVPEPQQGLEPQQGPDLQQGSDLQQEGPVLQQEGPVRQQEGPVLQQEGPDRSGCTAVGLLLSPDHLYFINCGDSRAVLYQNGGRVSFSTVDHKAWIGGELERIRNAGGWVYEGRVNGYLAVSRALGDYDLKCVAGKGPTEQLVSPEPEVSELKRASGELGDEFVVLACDGIWDKMSNEEVGAFVRSRLQLWSDLETVCNALVDTCLHKGSRDNMSVVLVCFPGAPKVSEEAKSKEKELDEFLETRVGDLLKSDGVDGVPDLKSVMKSLADENIKDLPPGGGLDSKHSVIEAAYNKLNPPKEEAKEKESPLENGKADDPNPIQEDTIE